MKEFNNSLVKIFQFQKFFNILEKEYGTDNINQIIKSLKITKDFIPGKEFLLFSYAPKEIIVSSKSLLKYWNGLDPDYKEDMINDKNINISFIKLEIIKDKKIFNFLRKKLKDDFNIIVK